MTVQQNEELVKITSGGTISIPIQFRKFLELQKGDYVKESIDYMRELFC